MSKAGAAHPALGSFGVWIVLVVCFRVSREERIPFVKVSRALPEYFHVELVLTELWTTADSDIDSVVGVEDDRRSPLVRAGNH